MLVIYLIDISFKGKKDTQWFPNLVPEDSFGFNFHILGSYLFGRKVPLIKENHFKINETFKTNILK